jgi:hypothetical protein
MRSSVGGSDGSERRPVLGFHVRRRVEALDDANRLDGQDVTEPLAMADE